MGRARLGVWQAGRIHRARLGWAGLLHRQTQAYVDSGFGAVFGLFNWSGSNSNAEGNAVPDNAIHFGNATLGELVPAVKGITLSNPGGGPLTISGFAVNVGKDFRIIVRDPSGAPVPVINGQFVIPPNSAFNVDVQFTPTGPGARLGSLNFFTDDPNDKGNLHTLSFDGVGQGMHAPTLTKIGTLTGAFIEAPFAISREALLQQSDAADVDPGTILPPPNRFDPRRHAHPQRPARSAGRNAASAGREPCLDAAREVQWHGRGVHGERCG